MAVLTPTVPRFFNRTQSQNRPRTPKTTPKTNAGYSYGNIFEVTPKVPVAGSTFSASFVVRNLGELGFGLWWSATARGRSLMGRFFGGGAALCSLRLQSSMSTRVFPPAQNPQSSRRHARCASPTHGPRPNKQAPWPRPRARWPGFTQRSPSWTFPPATTLAACWSSCQRSGPASPKREHGLSWCPAPVVIAHAAAREKKSHADAGPSRAPATAQHLPPSRARQTNAVPRSVTAVGLTAPPVTTQYMSSEVVVLVDAECSVNIAPFDSSGSYGAKLQFRWQISSTPFPPRLAHGARICRGLAGSLMHARARGSTARAPSQPLNTRRE